LLELMVELMCLRSINPINNDNNNYYYNLTRIQKFGSILAISRWALLPLSLIFNKIEKRENGIEKSYRNTLLEYRYEFSIPN
jgi:hypothetical protein